MTLYFIGLGLSDEKDISLKGLEIIKTCKKVFLETYTSKLNCSVEKLESLYKCKIILADRSVVETHPDSILDPDNNVAFLVIGDPLGATTHIDLLLRAKEKGIKVEIIHNASIINSVGVTGLEIYKFGKVTSMPFFEPKFRPETPYLVFKENLSINAHTLILLDIKADQKKFMTISQAITQMFELEKLKKERIFTEDTWCIGCARLGSKDQIIKYGKASDLAKFDFGEPLHSLIVPAKLHFMEEEMLNQWKIE